MRLKIIVLITIINTLLFLAASQAKVEYKETDIMAANMKIRLIPHCQVVYENQAPSVEIEVKNVSETTFDLNEFYQKNTISLGVWRDTRISSKPIELYKASFYNKTKDSIPIPSFSKEMTKEEERVFDEKLQEFFTPKKIEIEPGRTMQAWVRTDPVWLWKESGTPYTLRLVIGNKVSNSIHARVIQQDIGFKLNCPQKVKKIFQDIYLHPVLEGNDSIVQMAGTWKGTEQDWKINRPHFELNETSKKICREHKSHIIDTLKCNTGNYRIRYELFAFAAEVQAFDLIPNLIDIISEYGDNSLDFANLKAFWMLGTLENIIGDKCGEYPWTIQITGMHGLWWDYLRRYDE